MIEKITERIFRIEVPLPNNPLKYTNSYLVRGGERDLLVDTGMNREECLSALKSAFERLRVEREGLAVAVTHLHADHIGLVGELNPKEVYFSAVEAEIVRRMFESPMEYWEEIIRHYIKNGFPEGEAEKMLRMHPGIRYTSLKEVDFTEIRDGDEIEVGDVVLRSIETPGHSPSHMCFLMDRILFSGDHVLNDITPNITWWPVMEDSLESYLRSLDKIGRIEAELVLPGHRRYWTDLRKRVEELRQHHRKRLQEAFAALNEPKTAWEVAPSITWDLKYERWEEVNVVQKWFAVGETMAHLEHLCKMGLVERIEDEKDGKIRYIRRSF